METRQIIAARLSFSSNKPFHEVLAAIKNGVGHPEITKFWDEIWSADTFQQIESIILPALSASGLMQFAEYDDGKFIGKHRGDGTPQSMRLLIGNPLIMKQMTELVPDAAAYAPVTILIDERQGKVHLSYDRMASLLSAYNNPGASKIASALDAKIESLIQTAI